MTAVLDTVEPLRIAQKPAERERPALVAQLNRLRDLLEGLRDERPAPPPTTADDAAATGSAGRLAGLFALSPFERDVVLLAAAVELEGDMAVLVSSLQGGVEPRPTFGLALRALPGGHWDALAPGSPLRRWHLVEPGAGAVLGSRPLQVDERILHYLTGLDFRDARLDGIVGSPDRHTAVAPSQLELAADTALAVARASAPVLLRIDGDDADAQLAVAEAVAAGLGRGALVVRAAAIPPPGPDLALVTRLVDREARLSGAVPIVDPRGAAEPSVDAFLDQTESVLAILVGESTARVAGRVQLHRSVGLPSPAEARGLWRTALGDRLADRLEQPIEEIAQQFRLSAAAVGSIATELGAADAGDSAAAPALRSLCRERARVPLEGLAERIEPAATWDDLVLPSGHRELLRQIVSHVRHRTQVYERWEFGSPTTRGFGVTALFAGESGTGKTLAAEVIAGELKLDLYRIDLSATVSKYIGETEKNLRRLFDAAEASGAVLLFDEADALFGKRGEVKDAHDRYANLEVAYLLQRMESYRGLAILTTNLRSNVDRGFVRRLRFVVQFPFPEAEQRAQIWRRTLPAAAPTDGLAFDRLARLNVSGGSIRSIALGAAFAAAEDETPLTPGHVLRAARVEYAKAERTMTDAETEALR
jgi:vesicle-fusing ATPase